MADSGLRSRNLTEARQAYASGDAAASLRAHSTPSPITMEGGHSTSYNDVSMAVVSGVYKQATKGTLFSLILLSALSQLDIPSKRLLVTIFSIAVSSGFVVYFLSSMDHLVEVTVYDRERKREAWELENYRKGEIDEIIELFETRGVEHNDAVLVVNKMAKYDNFFVDCTIEPITDYRAFLEKLGSLDRITELSAKIHPPNPLFGRLWGSLDKYVKRRQASEVAVRETAESSKGLSTELVKLIERILENPSYQPKTEPDITDAAMLMAADGYGSGKAVGIDGDTEVVVRTNESQKSFLFEKEPVPEMLATAARVQFERVSKERDMGH